MERLKEAEHVTTKSTTAQPTEQHVVPKWLREREFKHVPVAIAYTWAPKPAVQQRLTGFCFGDQKTWKSYKLIGDDLTEVLFGISDDNRAKLGGHDGWSVVAGVIRNRTRIRDLPSGRRMINRHKPDTWLAVLHEMSVREVSGLPPAMPLLTEHSDTETTAAVDMVQGWTVPVRLKPTCVAMIDVLLRPLSKARTRTPPSLSTTVASQPAADHAAPTAPRGMSWQVALAEAEKHVKSHSGAFPSVSCLAKSIGCSRRTIDKAVKNSTYLRARQAEAKAAKTRRDVQLSDYQLEKLSKDELSPLDTLIAEDTAAANRDHRQAEAKKYRK